MSPSTEIAVPPAAWISATRLSSPLHDADCSEPTIS
jgi:hypothetical protein